MVCFEESIILTIDLLLRSFVLLLAISNGWENRGVMRMQFSVLKKIAAPLCLNLELETVTVIVVVPC